MSKFNNKIVKEILEKYKTISAFNSLTALAGWDLNTYMPLKAGEERGFILGKIEVFEKKLLLDKEFLKLLKKAENEKKLNNYEKGVVRILQRRIKNLTKLPDKFIEEFNQLTNISQIVWRKSKENNDFKSFQPYLEKIVNLVKKQADYLGYKKHPYDALVDLYEEGWATQDFEAFFNSIEEELKSIFEKIRSSKNYLSKHPLENEKYQKENMEKVNYEVLKILNFDPSRSRLDISPHPFETSISLNDVRITTWYHQKDFARSLTAVIHEFGHSLYELNIDPDLKFTPLQHGVSYGFHESQSRFWENIIGRTPTFLRKILPIFKKHLLFINKYKFEDVVYYFNLVRPSLIRVEADEVTYHFHIILRFQIEKKLLDDSLKVKELPEYWNETIKDYLGIKPQNYREGVLQDIHWSMGAIGYFPTYSLGTFLSGLWFNKLKEELGELENIIKEKKGILKIQNWLKEKIYQYGSTYQPKDLIFKITKKEFSPIYFLEYLKDKYSKIYK